MAFKSQQQCAGFTIQGKRCRINANSSLRDTRFGNCLVAEPLRSHSLFCLYHMPLVALRSSRLLDIECKVIFIDLETTGLDVLQCEIVELAAVDATTGAVYCTVVKPIRGAPEGPTGVHGITAAEINTGPSFANVFERFMLFVEKLNRSLPAQDDTARATVFVAHNGKKFDFPVLACECIRHGIGVHRLSKYFFVDSLDILTALQDQFKATPCRKLQCLAPDVLPSALMRCAIQPHRALDDTYVLRQIIVDSAARLGVPLPHLVSPFSTTLNADETQTTLSHLMQQVRCTQFSGSDCASVQQVTESCGGSTTPIHMSPSKCMARGICAICSPMGMRMAHGMLPTTSEQRLLQTHEDEDKSTTPLPLKRSGRFIAKDIKFWKRPRMSTGSEKRMEKDTSNLYVY